MRCWATTLGMHSQQVGAFEQGFHQDPYQCPNATYYVLPNPPSLLFTLCANSIFVQLSRPTTNNGQSVSEPTDNVMIVAPY